MAVLGIKTYWKILARTMRTWGKYLEDRALHFWETKKNDFSGPFSEPLLDLCWTIFDQSWPYLTYFVSVWAGAGPPDPPTASWVVSPQGLFFSEKVTSFFFLNCVLCVFSKKWLLGQDFSPISLLFLHSNPIHFIFFSNPLQSNPIQSTPIQSVWILHGLFPQDKE